MSAAAGHDRRVFATPDDLAHQVADWIVERAAQAIKVHGRFSLCLSGGSTPKRLYEALAVPERRARIPWDRTHWFWGDERVVAHDDPQSNYGMARAALLEHAPVPAENVHAVPTEDGSAADAAAAYERTLQRFYGAAALDPARPLFDLTLLGLGEDGHIASLFPGSAALDETGRWAVPVIGVKSTDRVTLTYPVLESSRISAFVVTGASKHEVLKRVRDGDPALPAARFASAGAVYWFTDRAAAGAIPAFNEE